MTRTLDPELLAAAKYAHSLAESTCLVHESGRSCSWYHGAWPFFRVVEIVSTPKKHAEHFESELRRLRRRGELRRALISGSADYGMLKMVADGAIGLVPPVEITVIDQCATPLRLCENFARRHRLAVVTRQRNILDAVAEEPFDAVFTHAFLGYFNEADTRVLFARWRSMLRPGGRLVTVQRIRENYPDACVRFTQQEAAAFVESVARLSAPYASELGDYDLPGLAQRYVMNMEAQPIRSAEGLRRIIEASGFRLTCFARPEAQRENDITGPAVPNSDGYRMITAEKI